MELQQPRILQYSNRQEDFQAPVRILQKFTLVISVFPAIESSVWTYYITFNSGKKVKAGEKPKTYRIQWADSQDTAGCEQTFDGIPFHFGWVGVQCLSYSFHRWGTSVIQLCWQRSHKSVKAYSTIPICIMGSKSLVLLDWGSRWFSNKEQDRRNTRVCADSFRHSETPWGSITQP